MAPAVISTPNLAGGRNQTISTSRSGHSALAPDVARSTPKVETPSATVRHTVRRGETLWSIASDHLGAGDRYPQIAALNTDVLAGGPASSNPDGS